MVLQYITGTPDGFQETVIKRNIFRGKNFMPCIAGFYALREHNSWGRLYRLKGREKLLIATFGTEIS